MPPELGKQHEPGLTAWVRTLNDILLSTDLSGQCFYKASPVSRRARASAPWVELLTRQGRFSKLRRRAASDRQLAVASTVGTIMSLLVFLAFLSLFTTQYIPVWMTENEAQHGDEVLTQMACIRSATDLLILSGDRDTSSFCAIKMGANGVPVFAAPTAGIITLSSREPSVPATDQERADANIVEVNYNDSTTGVPRAGQSAGRLELYMPNRYFVQQTYAFENGGIVLNQTDGEWMRVGPHLRAERTGNTLVNMSFRIMSFVGKTESQVGVNAIGIKLRLMNVIDPEDHFYGATGCPTDPTVAISNRTTTIIIYSNYVKAWQRWWDSTLQDYGLSSSAPVPNPCPAPNNIPADYTISVSGLRITVVIRNLSYFSLTEATFNVKMGEETR